MRIKVAAVFFCLADLALFVLTWFLLAKAASKNVARHDQVLYLTRSWAMVILLLLCLLATIVLVFMWAQQVREEYRETSRRNLEELIEGALKDHEPRV